MEISVSNNVNLEPALYIVALPIGNPKDITIHALEILSNATIIACEDSRVTNRLLSHYGIKASMKIYNDFSKDKERKYLLSLIKGGKSLALVCDAGTPMISDPGYKLVKQAMQENITCKTIPGPSALTAAITLAGLPTNQFMFCGFLSQKQVARNKELEKLKHINASLIFYESPKRLLDCLHDMKNTLGNRQAAVLRELTKTFEEVTTDNIENIIKHYSKKDEVKGEIVIIIEPAKDNQLDKDDLEKLITSMLKDHKVKEIANIISKDSGIKKSDIYNLALTLKDKQK